MMPCKNCTENLPRKLVCGKCNDKSTAKTCNKKEQERIRDLEWMVSHLIFCIRDGMAEIGYEKEDMLKASQRAEWVLSPETEKYACKHSPLALCKNCADGILPSKQR